MKKILFSAVSALALASFAADSTQFGALQVLSTAKRTLVAIPWCEASTEGSDIAVSNLVLTANLTEGDTLDAIGTNGKSLNQWILVKDDKTDVLYWSSGTMVEEGNTMSPTPSSDSDAATIPRGSAVALIRQAYTNDNGTAIPFYVMGQVASSAASTTIVAPSSGTETNCYNMIAPPSVTNQYLNGTEHAATWTGTIDEDDHIIIPTKYLNIDLKYVAGNWCYLTTTATTKYYKYYKETVDKVTTYKKEEVKESEKGKAGVFEEVVTTTEWTPYETAIPVGTGFWYVSYGGTPTVTWSDVPTKE